MPIKPESAVDRMEEFKSFGCWSKSPAQLAFCPRINESHCNWNNSPLTPMMGMFESRQ